MKIRDEFTKAAFIEYLISNPEERFGQTVVNFIRTNFDFIPSVFLQNEDGELLDMFYWESE